jgi:DNA polymerase I-like protein with 3'-5' exonuclease and polymerase domains
MPPARFPNLKGVKKIGLDTETNDPNLHERGPGFIRGDAHVAGVSVATDDARWYFPTRHLGGGNMNPDAVNAFLTDLLKEERWIIGASLLYDQEALWSTGITINPKSRLIDVQIAEAILEEERDRNYKLETLCQDYLDTGKDETLLREAASAYGVSTKEGLWKLHSKYVGSYAEFDAWAPLKIFEKQYERLKSDDLLRIFELESRLLPLIWKMRLNGIPVDLEAAASLSATLKEREGEARVQMRRDHGHDVDVWSGDQLAAVCDKLGISYPRTPKGNPSFESEFLESDEHEHAFLRSVGNIRKLNRFRSTFIDDWIFGNQIRGKVHPEWRQLMSDEGGTRTGRMAAANPNPQQVPADKFRDGRPNAIGEAIRKCFVARPDKWAKIDYSQQEPRILVHYAFICGMAGAEAARDGYAADRKMDIYQFLANAAQITRRHSKDMTLGRMYGMGKNKLASKIGVSVAEAEALLQKFDAHVPFVKEMADTASRLANQRGWVQTLCGRKRHFNMWEPRFQKGERPMPNLDAARAKWPNETLTRYGAHKALNSLIQGSAADMVKSAILAVHDQMGLVPFMAVHDEIDYGVPDEETAKKIQHIAENCVDMKVPIVADLSIGDHWK